MQNMRTIDELSELDAKALLSTISEKFSIGKEARTASVLLTNVDNVIRRSECLLMIEAYHIVTVEDDNGEPMDEQLLHWGEKPEHYIETYKRALTPNAELIGRGQNELK